MDSNKYLVTISAHHRFLIKYDTKGFKELKMTQFDPCYFMFVSEVCKCVVTS